MFTLSNGIAHLPRKNLDSIHLLLSEAKVAVIVRECTFRKNPVLFCTSLSNYTIFTSPLNNATVLFHIFCSELSLPLFFMQLVFHVYTIKLHCTPAEEEFGLGSFTFVRSKDCSDVEICILRKKRQTAGDWLNDQELGRGESWQLEYTSDIVLSTIIILDCQSLAGKSYSQYLGGEDLCGWILLFGIEEHSRSVG